ncbi:hypothetical protein [Vitiosangium sp. GDMCC 1.1324]|uniref:hypothetical protein n=1 Tax=Vitiosangium sp. (strain GDMCC 1.1324) TaxID=2138576 RepID=UPI000D371767|nr:hypothetical protein [Vitiosangium sp. GDMCC 1.1324]PTL81955.1 hypothetical protein DAT35_19255 [Vitiosangium sp. GDMCC 1.1324]
MAEQSPPYWVLISVLFSSQPLSPTLAMTLHQAAFDLYRRGESVQPVAGDLLTGKVHNLRKDVQMGSISGPAFEAEIETERGSGVVRFLLTRQGLEMMQAQPPEPPPPPRPKYLN